MFLPIASRRCLDYYARIVRKPVRVIFANCPHLDESAAAYLVLAQNTVQTVFEFEVWHLYVYAEYVGFGSVRTKLLNWWSSVKVPMPGRRAARRRYAAQMDKLAMPPLRAPLKLQDCVNSLRPYLKKNDDWITSLPPRTYGNSSIKPASTIIVTETPLENDYVGWSEADVAVASIGEWRRTYTPPSQLEFILDQVQRYGLRLALNDQLGSHYPTRACVWDFDADVADARLSPLVGYLCDSCEQLISEKVTEDQLKQIHTLLSHKWIGTPDRPGSVASNLKRVFGYDLARTRGLSAGFLDRIREAGPAELLKLIAAGVTGIAGTLFVLWGKRHGLW